MAAETEGQPLIPDNVPRFALSGFGKGRSRGRGLAAPTFGWRARNDDVEGPHDDAHSTFRAAALPAHALFDMVNDVASYPQFLPWCSATEVLSSSETEMHASMTVAKAGLSQRFMTRNALEVGKRIEMTLEEGPFSHLHGIWEFKALGEKACKISLDLTFGLRRAAGQGDAWSAVQSGRQYPGGRFCERAKQLYG